MRKKLSTLLDALPKAWPFSELPGYRDHAEIFATYSGFSYEDLPPVGAAADGQLRWLEREPPKEEDSLGDADAETAQKLREIEAAADFTLPAPFVSFLRSPGLQSRVRSCTACFLELSDAIVPTVGAEEGRLIQFLSDQQGCLYWSLYVSRAGEECVLCSEASYGFDDGFGGLGPVNLAEEEVALCAPSFGEFLYRFWIENEIWFALTEGAALTEEQQAYVDHYRALRASREGT